MNRRELLRHADRLGFAPQDAVRWLSPPELMRTAVKVGLSELFADYSDKREVQAALDCELMHAPLGDPSAGELWLDYVADLGDGFDATATVAHLVATEKLTPRMPTGAAGPAPMLPRASLLVLGGDEVYPTADARGYEDRTKGPYRAALPAAEDQPLLVALPGNHDWYDGLTSFLRVFTQGRPIGGWQTRQTRSYFAVRLPQRWWLVGMDSQFGTYIDHPQLRYFEEHLSKNLEPGDGVIVCSATPTWVHAGSGDPDAFNSLHWFDRMFVRTRRVAPDSDEREETHASVRLWISGDSHHYVRFAERLDTDTGPAGGPLPADPRRRQLVTCGLGGAFMSSTERVPATLDLPPAVSRLRDKDAPVPYVRGGSSYPQPDESRRLARRLAQPWSPYWLPRRNDGFFGLAALLHGLGFLVLALAFDLADATAPGVIGRPALADVGAFTGWVGLAVSVLLFAPWLVRRVRERRLERPSSATLGVLAQTVVALGCFAAVAVVPWPAGAAYLVAAVLMAAAIGAVVGSEAFALYVLAARRGRVADWQLAGQAIEDGKGFVRMHVGADGALTLYPLVVDRVCRDWVVRPHGPGEVRPVPAEEPQPRLLEPPIVIAREARGRDAR